MNDDRDDEMETRTGTAYLMNNVVHSPRESPDNRRAARYITGTIIIICKPPSRASFSYLSLARILPLCRSSRSLEMGLLFIETRVAPVSTRHP